MKKIIKELAKLAESVLGAGQYVTDYSNLKDWGDNNIGRIKQLIRRGIPSGSRLEFDFDTVEPDELEVIGIYNYHDRKHGYLTVWVIVNLKLNLGKLDVVVSSQGSIKYPYKDHGEIVRGEADLEPQKEAKSFVADRTKIQDLLRWIDKAISDVAIYEFE